MEHSYRNELYHHGILGQKWGKRNGPPYPLRASDHSASEKKAGWRKSLDNSDNGTKNINNAKKYLKIGAIAAVTCLAVCGGVYLYKSANPSFPGIKPVIFGPLEDYLDGFSDSNGVTYKKGTVFTRITSNPNADCINRGSTYVAKLFGDRMKYEVRLPKESWNMGSQMYVHRLKATTEIKAPSSREAAKLYLKLHPDAKQSDFINFMTYEIRSEGKNRDEFVKALNELGFNAVIDENDYGWTTSPINLLNPSKIVKSKSIKKLGIIERVVATILQ